MKPEMARLTLPRLRAASPPGQPSGRCGVGCTLTIDIAQARLESQYKGLFLAMPIEKRELFPVLFRLQFSFATTIKLRALA
jgi:hypothetical protein